ncbi:MAG: replication-associated recombination protein A [Acidimicrobiales bacterium]|nr:replication-associated recombination protein A [Acidimicrobiales bacterium]
MDDLFSAAASEKLRLRAPLAARLRPQSLKEIEGQEHLLSESAPLKALIEADKLTSVILWGPPGCGKTSLARLIAHHTAKDFMTLSAVSASVKDVRSIIEAAGRRLGEHGIGTILFLDEVHRFNKSQQDALLPSVEDGLLVLIGATTENPYFEVNAPLLSRSNLFRMNPLSETAVSKLLHKAVEAEGSQANEDAIEHLAQRSGGDARRALTALEVALVLAAQNNETVSLRHAELALDERAHRYGSDEHYDVISAFIKSIRGSDVDAGLYWLARMLEAGEDAKYIARRLVILASEDIGMADPQSLLIADAAARAVEFVGLPEAQLNLAQAVIHLATAPKSCTAKAALHLAISDVRDGKGREVPIHLRDGTYAGAKGLGHGEGYIYPHNDPKGWVDQQHLPVELTGTIYYQPTNHGFEAKVSERMAELSPDEKTTDL